MSLIGRVHAREILDSRGRPTVEVDVLTDSGAMGRASVPSGASTGRHEALELRDGDPSRHGGRGVREAVSHVNDIIAPALAGCDVTAQRQLDETMRELDGTPSKTRLGANAILGTSMAVARAAAAVRGVPLWRSLGDPGAWRMPLPMVNMISGGLHASGGIDLQDFLLIPAGADSCRAAIETALHVNAALGELLRRDGWTTLMADEGGYGPPLPGNEAALAYLTRAIEAAGLAPGRDAAIALDVASTHFHDAATGTYRLTHPDRSLAAGELVAMLADWCDRYPVVSIEDGCAEDDWEGWKTLTEALGDRVQLVGDDLFTTNSGRLAEGIRRGVANSVLVKMNQIGTITETIDVCRQAVAAGYRPVVSARSGETEDPFLADLAVATGAGQIKVGCVRTSERMAKYNQLLRIEEELGPSVRYPGRTALAR